MNDLRAKDINLKNILKKLLFYWKLMGPNWSLKRYIKNNNFSGPSYT